MFGVAWRDKAHVEQEKKELAKELDVLTEKYGLLREKSDLLSSQQHQFLKEYMAQKPWMSEPNPMPRNFVFGVGGK